MNGIADSPRPGLLRRPGSAFDPGKGLLRSEHFQMAYATNNLDAACDLFSAQFGITEFASIGGVTPQGGEMHVRLAWVGTIMYELMEASGPGSELVMDRVPAGSGLQIGHHHLGYLVHTPEDWAALEAEAARAGFAILRKSANPGFMTSCFVDVPQLGHYLEFIMPEPAGRSFFEQVPGL